MRKSDGRARQEGTPWQTRRSRDCSASRSRFRRADDEAERELRDYGAGRRTEVGEPAFEGEPEFEEDLEDDSEDSLTYSNGVIEKIVAMATREVPHVLGMKGNLMHLVQETFGAENLTKGVTVEVTDDNRVIVNISVIIEYGCYAPAIFEDVKERVTEASDRYDRPGGCRHQPAHRGCGDAREYEASKKRHAEDDE
ncbi:MAG: Asp23/Gls24 family envelope stress response protein [Collinsella sp.]